MMRKRGRDAPVSAFIIYCIRREVDKMKDTIVMIGMIILGLTLAALIIGTLSNSATNATQKAANSIADSQLNFGE
jgi:hypothetical protein